MVTTLIVTHGGLAEELLAAAEIIVGEQKSFSFLTLDWDDSFEEARRKTEAAIEELDLDADDQVLILTDMYGSTPYNVAASLAEPGKIEVLSGVNLPMVVRLGCPDIGGKTVTELAEWIQAKARTSICRAGVGNGTSHRSKSSRQVSRDG